MNNIPCEGCIAFPVCSINKLEANDDCLIWVLRVLEKCSLFKEYINTDCYHTICKIEKFVEVVLYLCNQNIYSKTNHFVFSTEEFSMVYCISEKRLFEFENYKKPCPFCGTMLNT